MAIELASEVLAVLQQQARESEQSAARYGLKQNVRPDAARARLKWAEI